MLHYSLTRRHYSVPNSASKAAVDRLEARKAKKYAQFKRYYLFFVNLYIFFVYGLLIGSLGITLNQFGRILNSTTQQLSIGLSAQAIFGCVASLLATYSLDRWNRDLQFAICVLFLSLIIISFPFSISLSHYLFFSSAIGFFTSVINCINTITVLELFRHNPTFYIQVLFFFYPLGVTFSGFFFSPFLDHSNLISNSKNDTLFNQTTLAPNTSPNRTSSFFDFLHSLFQNVEKTNIWIPYLAVGLLMMLGSFLLFISVFLDLLEKGKKNKKVAGKENESFKSKESVISQSELNQVGSKEKLKKRKILAIIFVVLNCIIVTLEVGSEINFVNFVPTFLTRLTAFDFSEQEASYTSIILNGMFTLGRFVNIFLSLKIETELMIYLNFLLMISGNLVLVFFSSISIKFIWIGIGLIGYGFSSNYPLIIAFIEKRYLVDNVFSSLLEFSSLFFVCFSPVVLGYVLDNIPDAFILIYLYLNLLILSLFGSVHFMSSLCKFRNG